VILYRQRKQVSRRVHTQATYIRRDHNPSLGHHQLATTAVTGPRAEVDAAEPPVVIIRETHRLRLCKALSWKATLGDPRNYRTFYRADRVHRLGNVRVASGSMSTPLLRRRLCGRHKCSRSLMPGPRTRIRSSRHSLDSV
jgi:hypothetical protein